MKQHPPPYTQNSVQIIPNKSEYSPGRECSLRAPAQLGPLPHSVRVGGAWPLQIPPLFVLEMVAEVQCGRSVSW